MVHLDLPSFPTRRSSDLVGSAMDIESVPDGVGQALRRHRMRAGLSQERLARQAGLSLRAIRDIERGRVRQPRQDSLIRLAGALRLSDREQQALLTLVSAATLTDRRPQIGVLGPMSVWRAGVGLALGPPMPRHLLGLLALHPGRVVRRDDIIDMLWPDRPPKTCLSLVTVYIAQLRALLDPGPPTRVPSTIAHTPGGYRLDVVDDQVDLTRFDGLLSRAQRARAAGDPIAASEYFTLAMRCWRGPVLADASPHLRQHPTAVDATRRRVTATLAYSDLLLEVGRPQDAIGLLRELLGDDPLHEALHAGLILALAGAGEQAAALQHYRDLRHRLVTELGAEPGPELQAAHMRVLRREVAPPQFSSAAPSQSTRGPDQQIRPAQLPPVPTVFAGRRRQLRL